MDIKQLKKYTKKINWSLILTIVLLIIPLFLSVYYRSFPITLPTTDTWAKNNVYNYYKSQITNSVQAQFPNLPDDQKKHLVDEQFKLLMKNQDTKINSQIEENSKYLKSKFQNENGTTYLLAIDPYHYYRLAKNLIHTGHMYDTLKNGKPRSTYMLFPNGGSLPSFQLHVYFIVFLYYLLNFFGSFSLMRADFLVPIIVSALGVIPAFFIGKKLKGNVAGFFSATMYAVHSALLTRTIGGFSDTDAYNVVFPLYIFWFILESFYSKKLKTKIIFASLAGLLTSFFALAWIGWWYSFTIILMSLIGFIIHEAVIFLKNNKKSNKKSLKNTSIITAVFFVVTGFFITIFKNINTFFYFIKGPLSFMQIKNVGGTKIWPNVFTTVAELNKASISSIINSMYGKIFFFIALAGIIFSSMPKKKDKLAYKYMFGSLLWYFLMIFVLKLNQLSFILLLSLPLIAIYILDILYDLKVDMRASLILGLWLISTIYASTKGIRFTLVMVPAFSIAFGFAVSYLIDLFTKISSKELNVSKSLAKIIFVLIAVMVLLYTPITQAEKIAMSEVPSMNDDWYDSLKKIDLEANKFAVINSWWDFGHWFKAIGNRPVTFDGGTQNTPQAHWIGKVLLTSNETEAMSILRMLDCGGNNAFNEINKILKDELDSKLFLDELILKQNRDEASEFLDNLNINQSEKNKILDATFCSNLPEDYFITSDDMIGKSGVWAHFGAWNFTRATMVNLVTKNSKERKKSVEALKERFGYNDSLAEKYYDEIISHDPDKWIADWPSYVSKYSSCSLRNDLLICGNGLVINTTSEEPYVTTYQGKQKPKSLSYINSEGEYVLQKFDGKTIPYSAALIRSGNTFYSIFMVPSLAGSMFSRLYFFNGVGLKYFDQFSNKNLVSGGHVSVWKVNWNPDNTTELSNKEDEFSNDPVAVLNTSRGTIELELFKNKAPKTVENFINLSESGFYDNTLFHRVIKDFMIQGGDPLSKDSDPTNDGTGGPGYTIPDEISDLKFDKKGILAMANAGPNTGGSQFFITVAETPWLNGKYTIFGKVLKGYDVVENISLVKTDSRDRPLENITVYSIKIKNEK